MHEAQRALLIQAAENSPQGVGLSKDPEDALALWLCLHEGWLRQLEGCDDYFLLTEAGRLALHEKELSYA